MNKMKPRQKIHLILLILFLQIPNVAISEISILDSLTQEIETKIGETYQNVIYIKNKGENTTEIKIYQMDFLLLNNGKNVFSKPGTLARSNANWISIFPNQLTITPKATAEINYTVKVPENMSHSGTYWSMIIVEEISKDPFEGINQKKRHLQNTDKRDNRIGIQIITHLGDWGTGTLNFVNAKVLFDDSKSILQININNSGNRLLKPFIWVDIYNDFGGYVGRFHGTPLQIYPGTTMGYGLDLSKVPEGTYKALVLGQYNSKSDAQELNESFSLLASIESLELPENQQQTSEIITASIENDKINNPTLLIEENTIPKENVFAFTAEENTENLTLVKNPPKRTPERDFPDKENTHEKTNKKTKVVEKITEETSPTTKAFINFQYYIVRPGDWLSKIALKFYGDELIYPDIFNANRDKIQDENQIYPGQKLRIPTQQKQYEIYLVQAGDQLSTIAERFWGDAMKFQDIFQANRNLLKDENQIYPGQRLRIPSDNKAYNFYTVQTGDCLSKIAKIFFGDFLKFSEIYEVNREIIKDSELIYPGQRLKIPLLSTQNTILHSEKELSEINE